MTARFKFIHLSDFHFCIEPRRSNLISLAQRKPRLTIDACAQQVRISGFLSFAKPASFSPQIVSGVAQFCYTHREVTDGVLITGDLATTGYQVDIAAARDFVLPAAVDGFCSQLGKPTLSASDRSIYVLPGNHDRYSDAIATPKSRNFELTFNSLMPNLRNGVSHRVKKKNDRYLGIIFADFCLRERSDATNRTYGPLGQGRVYMEVLHELEARTRILQRKYNGISLIWGIHFAPYDCGSALALIDWRLVAVSAQSHRISATICGHTHVAGIFRSNGHTTYCAGSAGAIDQEEQSKVHIFNIDVGDTSVLSRENYVWNRPRGEFVYSDTE